MTIINRNIYLRPLALDKDIWNQTIVYRSFVLDWNNWYRIVYK